MSRAPWWVSVTVVPGLVLLSALAVVWQEVRTSALQSAMGVSLARQAVPVYRVQAGATPPSIEAPDGPWDRARGYANHREMVAHLQERGFEVVAAAHAPTSAPGGAFSDQIYPIFALEPQAGLTLTDRAGRTLERWSYPEVVWKTPPRLAMDAARLLENRALSERAHPYTNPAVDWTRLGVATVSQVRARLGSDAPAIGGSTLAVQMEKFRHSPDGRTSGTREKARQTLTAWLRTYHQGRAADAWAEQIVVDWLNSVPLGHRPGYGPVQGVFEGMWAWFGRPPEEVAQGLNRQRSDAQRAQLEREMLALIIAQQRPARYLPGGLDALERRVDALVNTLVDEGKVTREWGHVIASRSLSVKKAPSKRPVKGGGGYLSALAARQWGALSGEERAVMRQRDAQVTTTYDAALQEALRREIEAAQPPARTSVAIFARSAGRLEPRAIVDTEPRVVDLSTEGRVDLGSTSKLRVLVSYLSAVETIFEERAAGSPVASDPLSQFVTRELTADPVLPLDELLERALQRPVSADPDEVFYTGGGPHEFQNVNPEHDTRYFNVASAFVASANLPFVRLLREVVAFHAHRIYGAPIEAVVAGEHPRFDELFERHLKMSAERLVRDAYFRHHHSDVSMMARQALAGLEPTDVRCARLRRAIGSAATLDASHPCADASLATDAPADVEPWDDQDPLELAAIAALVENPEASLTEVMLATANIRSDARDWVAAHTTAIDTRRGVHYAVEEEVFGVLQKEWARAGYPFERLTPSLATALGSSGDRPASLALLVAAVRAGGLVPRLDSVEGVRLFEGTPYETWLRPAPTPPVRAFGPEVARAVEKLLLRVAERGTGHATDAPWQIGQTTWEVGGKTGTSDHVLLIRDRDGRVMERRPVARSGAWVFFAGPCLVGTVVMFEQGEDAATHHFHGGDAAELSRAVLRAIEAADAQSHLCEAPEASSVRSPGDRGDSASDLDE
ncbi:hypothetical protein FRC98_09280 [Lujinxingia vulgaris]|uniref:peptidoglycan glycosyltransferase n=1 Tax=Lujinxingia vulgaris TaxID=2600176 RepID=A0A5C6XJR5_9DELT|nr:transglycosylase domain-containing protein [Lujinxingia vulgaris]TXD37859.1 hypothetical protein FRC98_09280 [Lujinxingia vulgaris]